MLQKLACSGCAVLGALTGDFSPIQHVAAMAKMDEKVSSKKKNKKKKAVSYPKLEFEKDPVEGGIGKVLPTELISSLIFPQTPSTRRFDARTRQGQTTAMYLDNEQYWQKVLDQSLARSPWMNRFLSQNPEGGFQFNLHSWRVDLDFRNPEAAAKRKELLKKYGRDPEKFAHRHGFGVEVRHARKVPKKLTEFQKDDSDEGTEVVNAESGGKAANAGNGANSGMKLAQPSNVQNGQQQQYGQNGQYNGQNGEGIDFVMQVMCVICTARTIRPHRKVVLIAATTWITMTICRTSCLVDLDSWDRNRARGRSRARRA
jgi:hypothetical protein